MCRSTKGRGGGRGRGRGEEEGEEEDGEDFTLYLKNNYDFYLIV